MAIAAQYDFEIEQMDVVTAFLYSEITEEIYVEFPIGFNNDRKVCKLLKGLYGLKQAPRLWEQKRKEAFHKLGFEPLDSDNCVYNTPRGLSGITIATFVDDFLLIGPSLTEVNNLKIQLSKVFRIKDLGLCAYFLSVRITRNWKERFIQLVQDEYIQKVVDTFGLTNANSISSLIEVTYLTLYKGEATKSEIVRLSDKP